MPRTFHVCHGLCLERMRSSSWLARTRFGQGLGLRAAPDALADELGKVPADCRCERAGRHEGSDSPLRLRFVQAPRSGRGSTSSLKPFSGLIPPPKGRSLRPLYADGSAVAEPSAGLLRESASPPALPRTHYKQKAGTTASLLYDQSLSRAPSVYIRQKKLSVIRVTDRTHQ